MVEPKTDAVLIARDVFCFAANNEYNISSTEPSVIHLSNERERRK